MGWAVRTQAWPKYGRGTTDFEDLSTVRHDVGGGGGAEGVGLVERELGRRPRGDIIQYSYVGCFGADKVRAAVLRGEEALMRDAIMCAAVRSSDGPEA